MKIRALSPNGAPSWFLYDTMEETFAKHGHSFTQNVMDADVAFFDLGTGHATFDHHLMQQVFDRHIPVVCFDQFEYTNPPPETREWLGPGTKYDIDQCCEDGEDWAKWHWDFINHGQVRLQFIRRMPSKWIDFPDFCRPFDQAMYPLCDFPPTTKEELNSRPVDVCFVGATGMWRENIIRDLRGGGLRVDLEFVTQRMERDDWLNRQRRAKLFLSGDGPGDCSDRPYQLFAISPMLKFRNFHNLPAPWTHGVDCIEASDEFGNMQDGDEEMIQGFLNDPDALYNIYLNGINHIKTHNSFEARSEYILSQLMEVGLK